MRWSLPQIMHVLLLQSASCTHGSSGWMLHMSQTYISLLVAGVREQRRLRDRPSAGDLMPLHWW